MFTFRIAIAAWSSGTGGAGLIGSFSYALLTEPSMGNLQPKVALLIQLFVPIVFALTYFFVLVTPEDVHTPGLNPKTWIVPKEVHKQVISSVPILTLNDDGWPVRAIKSKTRSC
ncbi:hypothetical protein COOONC_17767 [Cooperia oncophora]